MIGICTEHGEPDLWFSDTLDQIGAGAPKKAVANKMIDNTLKAIKICGNCPIQEKCKQLGMLPENLEHGVWGGTMAGERLLLAKVPLHNTALRNTVIFAQKVRTLEAK